MSKVRLLTGLSVQWPISGLILSGEKTVETRTYPLAKSYLNQEMLIIETPGKRGAFQARVVAIVRFTNCFQYKNSREFYADIKRHHVSPKSDWAWNNKKPKWGWEIEIVKKFDSPIKPSKRVGIIYTKNLPIPE